MVYHKELENVAHSRQKKGFAPFFLFVPFLFVLGCKTYNSQLDTDAKDTVLGQKEIERLNGDWRENRIENPDAHVWDDFQKGNAAIDEAPYAQLWKLYQNFVVPKGERFLFRKYSVRLHMHRQATAVSVDQNAPVEQEYLDDSESELTPEMIMERVNAVRIKMQNAAREKIKAEKRAKPISQTEMSTPTKQCNVPVGPEYRTLTYELLNYRQPNLARNFLVLAKLKFFDGKPLGFFRASPRLVFFGIENAMPDPFFYTPDAFYTDNNAVITEQHNPVGSDDDILDMRNVSGTSLDSTGSKFKNRTDLGALVGIAENIVGLPTSRKILALRAGISAYSSASQESTDALDRHQTFPVVFGRPRNSRQNQLDILTATSEMMQPGLDGKKYEYIVDCVEILPAQEALIKPLEELPQ